MKKIIASLVAIAIASSVAFAEVKFSFYNKLYEDDTIAWHEDAADDTYTDFPAIKERMYFEVLTDRVDAMVKATVALNDYDEKHFGLQGSLDDWYIEFRPIEILTLGMHTGIFSDGSYLPIYDDNLYAGNIGSEGFTVTLRPAKDQDLRIALAAPFSFDGSKTAGVNWLNGNKDDGEDEEFNIGIGAIYGQDLFQIGLSLQDVIDSDERQFGAYINLPTLFGVSENLTLGAGFAHTWADYALAFDDLTAFGGIGYENLLNAYATFDLDKVSFAAELLYNLGGNDDYSGDEDYGNGYDFYSAVSVSFGLADALTATATGKILTDLTSSSKGGQETAFAAAFALDYDINDNNTVGVEFDFDTCDSNWAIAVPLYWKYHFDN